MDYQKFINLVIHCVLLSVESPLYEVAKFLHGILRVSIKKSMSYTKDSWSFVNNINRKIMEPQEIFVSFDVTSLFTNISKKIIM